MNLISLKLLYSHNQYSPYIFPLFSAFILSLSGWKTRNNLQGACQFILPVSFYYIFTFHSGLCLLPGFCGGGEVEIKRNGIKRELSVRDCRQRSQFWYAVYIYFSSSQFNHFTLFFRYITQFYGNTTMAVVIVSTMQGGLCSSKTIRMGCRGREKCTKNTGV